MADDIVLKCVIGAIYARYSCDQQRETSIDDQVRRCKEHAAKIGLHVTEWVIYTDSALSGQAHALNKRAGVIELDRAWSNNEFDILLLDAFERLARDGLEQEKYIKRLNDNRRVRLLTCDGVDSAREDWECYLRIKGVVSHFETGNLRHRVGRGMVGQLERGYMIATPAYGYTLLRVYDDVGNHLGSHWVVDDSEAAIVREIFLRKKNGASMHAIARWLNDSGIPCSRGARKEDGGFWRPSRVRGILANPIYRGLFVWHGSPTYRYKAEKRGEEVAQRDYPRPDLRLVTDEDWSLCNPEKNKRKNNGGGKNALAGVLTCGCCAGTLVLTAKTRCQSLYCAVCTTAKASTNTTERLTSTIAKFGVEFLLTEALRFFLTPEFVKVFHGALHSKLTGGARYEYEACLKELKRCQTTQNRFVRMLANVDEDDPLLEGRYEEARRLVREAEARLKVLEVGQIKVDEQAIAAQMQTDPSEILDGLFDSEVPPEQLRAMLRRLFPSIVFEGKEGRYHSFFRVRFCPGAALAVASNTACQVNETIEYRFGLRYVPRVPSKKYDAYWELTSLGQVSSEKLKDVIDEQ